MDIIIGHWQEIVSLLIVLVTVVLLFRSIVGKRRYKKECSSCALMELQTKKHSSAHR